MESQQFEEYFCNFISKLKFCELLKQAHIEKGLSQKQLADALNVSESGYAHWEQGRTEPNIEILIKLANFFDITIDDLVGRL